MPFTPTHVVAIVPIAAIGRGRLPFSALAIGSMIPDLPLFWPWGLAYSTTHSAQGIFTACLPTGLMGFLLFQFVMKRPLAALLPDSIWRRCSSIVNLAPSIDPKALGWASLAVVLGAVTHVVWDAFTHQGRWGTVLFPWLNETVLVIGGIDIAGYRALQHGSSLLGLPALAMILAIWLTRQPSVPVDGAPSTLSGRFRTAAALVVLIPPIMVGALAWQEGGSTGFRLFHSITNSGLALIFATLAYCMAYLATDIRRHRMS